MKLPACLLTMTIATALAGCTVKESAQPESKATDSSGSSKTLRTTTGVDMALVPAGEFVMGDDLGEDDERPARHVRVGAFYMDVCEVTQRSFETMLGRNPSKSPGPDKPVERVSWFAAVQYCNMRSSREGLKPCYDLKTFACDFTADGYRLPTEAEWEYACRAGSTSRWSFGDAPGDLARHGWFKANSGKTTHPVGQKLPNAFGLCDMHGNVAEWCNDFYGEHYESGATSEDPHGPATGSQRVLRGGSFATGDDDCRSAARHGAAPGFADVCFGSDAYGFRCVRRPKAQPGP